MNRLLGRTPDLNSMPSPSIRLLHVIPPTRPVGPHDGVDEVVWEKHEYASWPSCTRRSLELSECISVTQPPLYAARGVYDVTDGAVNEVREVSIEELEELAPGSRVQGPGFDPRETITNIMAQGRQCGFVDNC